MKKSIIIFDNEMFIAIKNGLKTQARFLAKGSNYPYKVGDILQVFGAIFPRKKFKLKTMKEQKKVLIEITGINLQAINHISVQECINEGISRSNCGKFYKDYSTKSADNWALVRLSYYTFFNKKYGAGAWEANPLVWVLNFKLLQK